MRVGAAAMGVVFGAVAASSALSYVGSFPTEASRQSLVASLSGDAGFSVLFGRVDAIGDVGGYTAYKSFVFLSTMGAVWAGLAVTRLLRGEEDAGRWELIVAGRTNPGRATAATLAGVLAGVGVIFAVTAVLTVAAGTRPGVGFGVLDSTVFALSLAVAPAVFGAVAAVCSQLASTRRQATALTMGVLAVAFVLRMIGDSNPSSRGLLWVTPLGWIELVRPFTADHLWPLAVAAAVTGGLGAASVLLAGRRDVGRGLVATSAMTKVRPFGLESPLGLAARLNGPELCGWAGGIALVAFVFGIVAKAATSAVAESSSARSVLTKLGADGGGAAPYLGVVFLLLGAVLALVPASQLGSARDEEASGRLAQVLAGQPTRRAWLIGRVALAAGAIVAIGLLAGAASWAGAISQGLSVDLGSTLAAGANLVPAALVTLAIGALTFAVAPRLANRAVYLVVGWSLVVDLLGSLVPSLSLLPRLSLLHYVALAPAEPPRWPVLITYTVVAAVLVVASVLIFDRRDLAAD